MGCNDGQSEAAKEPMKGDHVPESEWMLLTGGMMHMPRWLHDILFCADQGHRGEKPTGIYFHRDQRR